MKKDRIISLNGEVNEGSSLMIILQLLDLENQNNQDPIYLYINSGGGSIVSGLAIYDVINHIKAPVYTVCCGMAASMGAFLLSCGEKGHRYALPHSRILIHQPLIFGNYYNSARPQSMIEKLADGLDKKRIKLETIMAENADKSFEEMHASCERDNWMDAKEALEYGLIDCIL